MFIFGISLTIASLIAIFLSRHAWAEDPLQRPLNPAFLQGVSALSILTFLIGIFITVGKFGLFFLFINFAIATYGIIDWSKKRNANGIRGIATPGGWVWVWHFLGVIAIFLLGKSPYHLLWWLPAGFIFCSVLGRILYRCGVLKL